MITDTITTTNLIKALDRFKAIEHGIKLNIDVKVQGPDGREYNFSYADLNEIQEKVKPGLEQCGLTYIQTVGDECSVTTTLIYKETGESISSKASFPLEPGHSYQSYGQAITYLKRYSLVAMLGLKAESDDDANTASGNKAEFKVNGKPKLDRDKMQNMVNFINDGKWSEVERSLGKYDLTDSQKHTLVTLINQKKAQATMEGAKK